jgi:hypothetical protein
MSESRKKSKMAALALLAFAGSAAISSHSVLAAPVGSDDVQNGALNVLQSIDTKNIVEKDVAAKIEQAKQLLEESSKTESTPDGARNPTCMEM